AAVVGELEADLMLAAGQVDIAVDLESTDPEEVVVVGRLAFVRIDRPAPERAALGDDDAVRPALRHLDLPSDRMRLVLQHYQRVLGQPAHPAEQDLPATADQLWAA